MRAEMVGGQQFTRPERTPFLVALADRAQTALTAAVAAVAPEARVLRDADVLLSAQAAAIPDLAVYRGPTWDVPDLIVEYRAESTDRLFFGPKRLAYGRGRVPEVWFVDAGKATVSVLRLGSGLDYPWPAETYGAGQTLRSSAIAGLTLGTDALLPSADYLRTHRHLAVQEKN
jgi:Uma2 family endonuclease